MSGEALHGNINHVQLSAFVDSATRMLLTPPREYADDGGRPARTGWTLRIGFANQVTLYFDDPADLDRLAALLTSRGQS